MIPKDLTKDIKTRLQSIRGQVEGLIGMLDEDRDPQEILNQFKSVRKSLDRAEYLLLDEVYRKALAIGIAESLEACPGNCGNEEKIEYLRKEFPKLELEDLTEKMKEISSIKANLKSQDL